MSADLSLYELVSAVRESPEALRAWAAKRARASGVSDPQRAVDDAWYAALRPQAMLWVVDIVQPKHVASIRSELGTHLRACPATRGVSLGCPLTNSACVRCAGTIRHMMREPPRWDALIAYSLAWQAKGTQAKTETIE